MKVLCHSKGKKGVGNGPLLGARGVRCTGKNWLSSAMEASTHSRTTAASVVRAMVVPCTASCPVALSVTFSLRTRPPHAYLQQYVTRAHTCAIMTSAAGGIFQAYCISIFEQLLLYKHLRTAPNSSNANNYDKVRGSGGPKSICGFRFTRVLFGVSNRGRIYHRGTHPKMWPVASLLPTTERLTQRRSLLLHCCRAGAPRQRSRPLQTADV